LVIGYYKFACCITSGQELVDIIRRTIFPSNIAAMPIKFIYFTTLLFIITSIFLVAGIVSITSRKRGVIRKNELTAGKLREWLMEVILENENLPINSILVPVEIDRLLKKGLAREVLLEELCTTKKSLRGLAATNMVKLYKQLNLDTISRHRIASKKWHIQARGIQELSMMNCQDAVEVIIGLTGHSNLMLRMEAQTAIVRLQGYNGLRFFENLCYPLSEWHQLNLLWLLEQEPVPEEYNAVEWLKSPNTSVVQFGLKLIGKQRSTEFHDQVVSCLRHEDPIVRQQAILCIAQLPNSEGCVVLMNHYVVETEKNIRLSIIRELRGTEDEQSFSFLENLENDDDPDIRLAGKKTRRFLLKN